MMRVSALLAALPALVSLSFACDSQDAPATGSDSSVLTPDAGSDATAEVLNVGAACSADSACQGPSAQCLTHRLTTQYTGGYCTADCSTDAECGSNGVCPVGETRNVAPSYPIGLTWAHKCFQTCTGAAGECRQGYQCQSLARAYIAYNPPAPLQRLVCIPAPNLVVTLGAPHNTAHSDASVVSASKVDAGEPSDE
jgi:hypothetical protein